MIICTVQCHAMEELGIGIQNLFFNVHVILLPFFHFRKYGKLQVEIFRLANGKTRERNCNRIWILNSRSICFKCHRHGMPLLLLSPWFPFRNSQSTIPNTRMDDINKFCYQKLWNFTRNGNGTVNCQANFNLWFCYLPLEMVFDRWVFYLHLCLSKFCLL
jgi:hypothetical protein